MDDWQTYLDGIVRQAQRDSRSSRNDWPGTPLSHYPIRSADAIDELVQAGRVEIVAVDRGDRTLRYVAPKAG